MKSKKQLEAEAYIIEVMPLIEKDLLKIVDNLFKANPKFSEAQLKSEYGLSKDILCLGLEWLANQYGPLSGARTKEMNKLKPYIGTFNG